MRPLSCLAALALCVAVPALAQTVPVPSPAYTLPGTETFDLTAKDGGQGYRIYVSKPSQPAPASGYPVLYVLDANAFFPGFAGERRLEEFAKEAGGGVIVVGVGYPHDQVYDIPARTNDLTLPWTAKWPAGQPVVKTGGNEVFARFLLDQLRPEIARRYSVDARRQSLFGHSLGGLFALHMLYTRPDAFEAIVAASPSIWWSDKAILAEEKAFTERLAAGRQSGAVSRLLLVAGSRDAMTIPADTEALQGRLAPLSAQGLQARFEKLEGETHITVPYRAITPTFRFVTEKR
ncbi:MAG TPA: alpha/beta hydrolase-fold protein [Sphingomonas sp.]|nr:alpha/beta hydrolase-fold protein [Sphingomonas sp.]